MWVWQHRRGGPLADETIAVAQPETCREVVGACIGTTNKVVGRYATGAFDVSRFSLAKCNSPMDIFKSARYIYIMATSKYFSSVYILFLPLRMVNLLDVEKIAV